MTVRAHHPEDLHARRPIGRPGVLDPEGAAPAQGAHELRRRREARHAREREFGAVTVDLDGDRAWRVRFAIVADASDNNVVCLERPREYCLVADASAKMTVIFIIMVMASPTAWQISFLTMRKSQIRCTRGP